jgi:hypothetical protein
LRRDFLNGAAGNFQLHIGVAAGVIRKDLGQVVEQGSRGTPEREFAAVRVLGGSDRSLGFVEHAEDLVAALHEVFARRGQ